MEYVATQDSTMLKKYLVDIIMLAGSVSEMFLTNLSMHVQSARRETKHEEILICEIPIRVIRLWENFGLPLHKVIIFKLLLLLL